MLLLLSTSQSQVLSLSLTCIKYIDMYNAYIVFYMYLYLHKQMSSFGLCYDSAPAPAFGFSFPYE